jgi:hypothetical protein
MAGGWCIGSQKWQSVAMSERWARAAIAVRGSPLSARTQKGGVTILEHLAIRGS